MDNESRVRLIAMLRGQRVAALGTLRSGQPLVSQVLFAASPGLSEFYLRMSRLAQHTQDILIDPRVGLMIAEVDDGVVDPQTIARVSMRGEVATIANDDPRYAPARQAYLDRFPQSAVTFQLGDFSLYRFQPKTARYVAGFGKTFNLELRDFELLTQTE